MKLILTMGAPGSGKTTFARKTVKKLLKKGEKAAIFSKDDFRNMFTGSADKQLYWTTLAKSVWHMETAVRDMMFCSIVIACRQGLETVIIPDCHPTLNSIKYTIEKLQSCNIGLDKVEIYAFTENTYEELLAINEVRPEEDRLTPELIAELNNLCQQTLPEIQKYAKKKSNRTTFRMYSKNPAGETKKEE